jgi:hypothetical protein
VVLLNALSDSIRLTQKLLQYNMSKLSFLEMFDEWITTANFTELDRCVFKVQEALRNWGRVVDEMESDKGSFLWKDPFALAVRKEYNILLKLDKKAAKLYEKNLEFSDGKRSR